MALTFDGYWDGTTHRSSSASSIFQINKSGNQLKFITSAGATQGTVPSLAVAAYFDTSGNFNVNNTLFIPGNLSSSGQPCLIVSSSSYISVSTATNTAFNGWDTTSSTQGGITVTSNYLFTVPQTGVYHICCEMGYDTDSTGVRGMYLTRNNIDPPRYAYQYVPASLNDYTYLTTSTIIRLNANDTVQVNVYQTSGPNLRVGTLSGNNTARFEI